MNPYSGGAEVHLEELLRRLVKAGHQVTLFCSGFKNCLPEESVEGIRIVRRGNRFNFNLVAPFYLRRLVKENEFDILVEDINKIPFYTPWYLKLKTLVVVPHLFATTVFHEINFVLGTYIYLAERPLIHVYRGLPFNVISESTADDMVERGIPREDISVVHCGIDRDCYTPDSSVPKYTDPTVLYLGRIKKYKSVQHLLRALMIVKEKVPAARLKIVGTGDYLPHLKSLAASLGCHDDVDFPGFVSQEEKVEILRRSHVAVLPSLKEGWGLTNIEANSVGTTVVAADSPGLRDSVRDGRTGFLYEYGNIEQLADRLLKVLTDDDLRARLEGGGLEWADEFNWDHAAVKFEQLLIDTVGSKA
ncbi:MAG: glycosyltransferase family 4 protein [candidate division Zixibacteria bacterium]|nr:glycosyltransferase family 4 protein [candidate division Zixibacteria bacterium]MDH3938303.1 glycosyltransferase family 4 protein [candidate division Zixibacteria bacterium]